ncbi:MAG TPA: response regulator [Terriglobales bacterium]
MVSTAPTIVFIDDSATMREVIKIAFRRENIDVVAYSDAASALAQIEQHGPDVVITDVIMPDKDGYEVCQFIKNHPRLMKTPVILMSGVVNRSVAEKAFAVKADELIRKPFQPQDLITRVKHLLTPHATQAVPQAAAATLTSIFSAPAAANGARPRPTAMPMPSAPTVIPAAMPQIPAAAAFAATATATAMPSSNGHGSAAPVSMPAQRSAPIPMQRPAAASAAPAMPQSANTAPQSSAVPAAPVASNDANKLKMEILQLQGLVKKLHSELEAEREYVRSLEEQLRFMQG